MAIEYEYKTDSVCDALIFLSARSCTEASRGMPYTDFKGEFSDYKKLLNTNHFSVGWDGEESVVFLTNPRFAVKMVKDWFFEGKTERGTKFTYQQRAMLRPKWGIGPNE